MRARVVACFLAGLAATYTAGLAAFFAVLWLVDSGRGRHPIEAFVRWIEEHRHVV